MSELAAQFEPAPDAEQLEIEVDGDEQSAVESFAAWGWTDGLPIVAPTRERVEAMCAGATRYPLESFGNLAPRGGLATVQKIAVNAVMAGCLPAHMPVLTAAVEAMQDPEFNLAAVQTTTHPCALMAIVHGPIAAELSMNWDHGCFGPGNRANASIGRALRLILQNIGGALAGSSDMATQGSPAKYGFCFAENVERSPWPTFAASLGLEAAAENSQAAGRADDSCGQPAGSSAVGVSNSADARGYVTVAACEGPHNINDHRSDSGEDLLQTIAQTMSTVGNNNLYVGGDTFVVLGPEHAATIAASGFSREDAQAYLYEHARVPVERIPPRKLEELSSWGGYADQIEGWGGRIPLVREASNIRLLVAGGAGKHSAWCPTFGATFSATRAIVRAPELCTL